MAKLGKLTGPVMRSTTCLQRYRSIRLRCKEIQQLSSTDPLAEYHSTPLIRSENMKDVYDKRTPPSSGAQHLHFGHIDAVGGASTPS